MVVNLCFLTLNILYNRCINVSCVFLLYISSIFFFFHFALLLSTYDKSLILFEYVIFSLFFYIFFLSSFFLYLSIYISLFVFLSLCDSLYIFLYMIYCIYFSIYSLSSNLFFIFPSVCFFL